MLDYILFTLLKLTCFGASYGSCTPSFVGKCIPCRIQPSFFTNSSMALREAMAPSLSMSYRSKTKDYCFLHGCNVFRKYKQKEKFLQATETKRPPSFLGKIAVFDIE